MAALTREIFFNTQREISYLRAAMQCFIYYITPMKYQTLSMKQFFPAKGVIHYVAIATVIFSRVKITCYFHV